MGEKKFINTVTMESINRVMENQIRLRLKQIATNSLPDEAEKSGEESTEDNVSPIESKE